MYNKLWSTLFTYMLHSLLNLWLLFFWGEKIHFKNYIIWHLYIVFLHQPINFLHLPIVWLLTCYKGGTPLVPCFAHAILDHISACWHMQSGIGRLYMDSCGFLSPKPFVSLWRRISCMWCLNWSHLNDKQQQQQHSLLIPSKRYTE